MTNNDPLPPAPADAPAADRPTTVSGTLTFIVLALTLLVARSTVERRWAWYASLAYPNATDAGFYLHEFRSWLHGGSYYEERSLFFFLTSLLGRALGLDEVQLYWLVGGLSLGGFSAALVTAAYRRETRWLLPTIALTPVLSDLVFFRHFAFLRQFFSLSCLLLGVAIFSRTTAVGHPARRRSLIVAATLLFLLGASMHKFTAALAVALVLGQGMTRIPRPRLRLACGIVGIIALAVATLCFGDFFLEQRLPWRFGWTNVCRYMRCAPREQLELFSFNLLAIVATLAVVKSLWRHRTASVLPVLLCLTWLSLNLPLWKQGGALAFRLGVSSVWMSLTACCLLLGKSPRLESAVRLAGVWLAIAIVLLAPSRTYETPLPASKTLQQYAEILRRWIPDAATIRAPHGYQFALTYFLNRKAVKYSSSHSNPASDYVLIVGSSPNERCVALGLEEIPLDAECVAIEEGLQLWKGLPLGGLRRSVTTERASPKQKARSCATG